MRKVAPSGERYSRVFTSRGGPRMSQHAVMAEELFSLYLAGVGLRAVPCLKGGEQGGDYLRASDVDEMASNDPS